MTVYYRSVDQPDCKTVKSQYRRRRYNRNVQNHSAHKIKYKAKLIKASNGHVILNFHLRKVIVHRNAKSRIWFAVVCTFCPHTARRTNCLSHADANCDQSRQGKAKISPAKFYPHPRHFASSEAAARVLFIGACAILSASHLLTVQI